MPSSPESVTVHPLVLLSVVDHYNRVAKDTKKRVVGVLLGSISKGEVDVTNSFAGSPSLTCACRPVLLTLAGFPLCAESRLTADIIL
jgi:JAB1/Mov34/MPN/PAD-1 ubiquitin protease